MFTGLDHLIVAVRDLKEAENNYKKLFGISPVWKGSHKDLGTSNSLFNFENIYFELLSTSGKGLGADLVNYYLNKNGEGLIGMVFTSNDAKLVKSSLEKNGFYIEDPSIGESIGSTNNQIRKWKNLFLPAELTRGIFSFVREHTEGSLPKLKRPDVSSPHKLDHLVINTNDADGFIKIYRDIFNIRLALDKVIKRWHRRMLFFRLNQTTIEVIEQEDNLPPRDELWGLAWRVKNIEKTHQRLLGEGIEVTPIQKGVKEKTLVATIKSHTHNVPSLLIQHLEKNAKKYK